METVEQKMAHVARVMKYHDGAGAKELQAAKDYLIEASVKINSLRPIHDCKSCRHFRLLDCELVPGKMPPPEIIENGCEMWKDAFEIPWS